MKLVDLTRPLVPLDKQTFPQVLMPLFRIISPEVEFIDHKAGAGIMKGLFGCSDADLPEGEGWAEENISISSHLGTHVDAPWHYGSTTAGKRARTVDEIEVDELFCNAVVLDFSDKAGTGYGITVDDLKRALDHIECEIKPGDAVLIRSDSDKFDLRDPKRYMYPGLIRESSLWLAEQGAKIGGTDGFGWDRPFPIMISEFKRTGDKQQIWDAHFAFREHEFYVVQQLVNLDQLPTSGFQVAFFPIKLVGASAAPARAVAFIE